MNLEGIGELPPRVQSALEELRSMIRRHYPTAVFDVATADDDQQSIHLHAVVDAEDPDDVMNVVIDRLLELQVEEGLRIHVIPLRSEQRLIEALRTRGQSALPARGNALLSF